MCTDTTSPRVLVRVRSFPHFTRHSQAGLRRPPCLERAVLSLPDISRADVGPEVAAIERFEDVFDFVRDELDRVGGWIEENMRSHRHPYRA
jgi:hypothetical protein